MYVCVCDCSHYSNNYSQLHTNILKLSCYTLLINCIIHPVRPTAALAFSRQGYKFTDINLRDLFSALTQRGVQKLMYKHFRYGVAEMMNDIFSKYYALPN